jgi:hypothetical protein
MKELERFRKATASKGETPGKPVPPHTGEALACEAACSITLGGHGTRLAGLYGQRQGHVGLCIGDGQVVHAWDRVRIDHCLAVQNLRGPSGWDAPRWVGWTPIQRIFEGCRPKDWTAVGEPEAAAQRMQAARFGDGSGPT